MLDDIQKMGNASPLRMDDQKFQKYIKRDVLKGNL